MRNMLIWKERNMAEVSGHTPVYPHSTLETELNSKKSEASK